MGLGVWRTRICSSILRGLYCDVNVLSMWEGTTDMMAHDVLRVVHGKTNREVLAAMDVWVRAVLRGDGGLELQKTIMEEWWNTWKTTMQKSAKEEMEMRSREVMERLADVVMGVLLVTDARRDGDEIAVEAAEMWIAERNSEDASAVGGRWQDRAARDRRIVFGMGDLEETKAKL